VYEKQDSTQRRKIAKAQKEPLPAYKLLMLGGLIEVTRDPGYPIILLFFCYLCEVSVFFVPLWFGLSIPISY
jgi:hypothetical protein